MVFKCKMCGGALELAANATVAQCHYCGTQQTLPRLSDERRANLYDRAGHFRRNNEFDKAEGIYETVLAEDPTDAEAYWSLVLCRYGIEYVTDPASKRRLPTVNRTQFTSIFDDENYKAALAHADGYQRAVYEAEAEAINNIQKGILAISQKEEPFDVFICYKETDQSGRRTHDSVLAQELYYQLKQEGFRVFFSRITLEDKLGTAYEPYIFAALQSAKAMVVLGTDPAHFNAVWVKNEWSRYLSLIKNGAKKTLIPAYRDMDPYDLPEEFSHLQAQDMSKLGFMQDLVRGIKKIVGASAPKAAPAAVPTAPVGQAVPINVQPMMERVFLLLEDGDFEKADDLCEQVLNQDPRNAEAYFAKLLIELELHTAAQLATCSKDFTQNGNYVKIIRFGGNKIKQELEGYVKQAAEHRKKLIEEEERRRQEQLEKERLRRQREADEALEWQLKQAMRDIGNTQKPLYALDDAQKLLQRLQAHPDKPFAVALIPACEEKIAALKEALRTETEQRLLKAKRRKKLQIITLCAMLAVALIVGLSFLIYNAVKYETVDGIKYIKEDDGYHVLRDYSDLSGDVVIPAEIDGVPVTGILQNAFLDSPITSITIPDSVTSIGYQAFFNCNSLTTVEFGANSQLTSIGDWAFYSCNSLTTVEFGANSQLTNIGEDAFKDCTNLTTITIPKGVTSIGEDAFYNCSNLTSITIPDSVTDIGESVFSGCSSLQSITLPFVGGSKKTETDIDQYPFGYIFGTISYTGGVATEQYCYGYKTSSTTYDTYYIPATLKSVTITGGNILRGAFFNCGGLQSITIPNSVTSIGTSAFSNCSNLTSITIPDSVTGIGNSAFYACSNLTSVTIPASVTRIGKNAFYACSNLTAIAIPEGVTRIGDNAFYSCTQLTTVEFGANSKLTSIGDYTFYACSNLTSVTIPEGVTSIGDSAFYYCNSLTSIAIPEGVTSIGNSAFYNCSKLTSVTIPEGVTSIGNYAFYNCSNLTSITIPDSVTSIGEDAFWNCSNLTSITIPDSVTNIGDYAFSSCSNLTSITIPDSVTSIGNSAFSSCSRLTTVYYGGRASDWKNINIGSYNTDLTFATRYYYSATEPATAGNWWYYDQNGKPAIWGK